MRIAITGGIGSGKSEVGRILLEKGVQVLSADSINKELLSSPDYLSKLNTAFPDAFLDGMFNKKKLSEIVFGDQKALEVLNGIAHPQIMKILLERAKCEKLVFCEVPLLKKEWANEFDRIWIVKSNNEERVKRICLRDGRSRQQALDIIAAQEEYGNISYGKTDIINNDGDLDNLRRDVEKLYCELTVKNC